MNGIVAFLAQLTQAGVVYTILRPIGKRGVVIKVTLTAGGFAYIRIHNTSITS
jgi:hypothetical protein